MSSDHFTLVGCLILRYEILPLLNVDFVICDQFKILKPQPTTISWFMSLVRFVALMSGMVELLTALQ